MKKRSDPLRKALSVLLSMALTVGVLPLGALAAEPEDTGGKIPPTESETVPQVDSTQKDTQNPQDTLLDEPEVVPQEDSTQNTQDPQYVLMNIPYGEFYAAEKDASGTAANVDVYSSATKSKPLNGGLAGGSYHVNNDGTDITGIIYPVKVDDLSVLASYTQVTDDDSFSITVDNRGENVTTNYTGKEALFQNPSYSYYVLTTVPTSYKELTVSDDGKFSFGAATGKATAAIGVTPTLSTGGHHSYYAISMEGVDTAISGISNGIAAATLHTTDGNTYGLRHVVEVWRGGIELGFEDNTFNGLQGETIDKITYYLRDGAGIYTIENLDLTVPVSTKDNSITVPNTLVSTGTAEITADLLPSDFTPVYVVAPEEGFTITGTTIAWDDTQKVGTYTLTATDNSNKYAPVSTTFVLTTETIYTKYDDENKKLVKVDNSITDDDFDAYLKAISSVTVDGNDYAASGRNAVVIVKEDGSLDLTTAPFTGDNAKDSHSLTIKATGYPDLPFTLTQDNTPSTGTQYVLMNIPYGKFYAAVDTSNSDNVDAISSATNKAGNYGKSGGAYHSGETAEIVDGAVTAVGEENDAKNEGVIWPVQINDSSVLTTLGGTEITDESRVTVATVGRGQTSSTELYSYETLTEAKAYSYYVLNEAPDYYLTVTVNDGNPTFSIDNQSAISKQLDIAPTASYGTNWGDVQLNVEGASDVSDLLVNAVTITAKGSNDNETKVSLVHLSNIWSYSDIAWKVAQISGLDGNQITNIRYYCMVKDTNNEDNKIPTYQNYIYDYPVDLSIPPVYTGKVTAKFDNNSQISLSGLPSDIENPVAKVYHNAGGRPAVITYLTPLKVDPADQDIDPVNEPIQNGKIAISPTLVTVTNDKEESKTYGQPINGVEYTIEISSDNYIINKINATFSTSDDSILADIAGSSKNGRAYISLNNVWFQEKYQDLWRDYCTAVLGKSAAEDTVKALQASVSSKQYGPEYKGPNFCCDLIADAETIIFGPKNQITVKNNTGKVISEHTYRYFGTDTIGTAPIAFDCDIYMTDDENAGEFKYFLFREDTPETTYHIEFRYGNDLTELKKSVDGKYAYWLAAGILQDADDAMIENGIALFCLENMDYSAARSSESLAQISTLLGEWDFYQDNTAKHDMLYFTVDRNGRGQTYSNGTLAKTYQVYAFDNDGDSAKNSGIYITYDAEGPEWAKYSITTSGSQAILTFTGIDETGKPYTLSYSKHASSTGQPSNPSNPNTPDNNSNSSSSGTSGSSSPSLKPLPSRNSGTTTPANPSENQPSTQPGSSFTDVPSTHWASSAIDWAKSNGYMTGTSQTAFNPEGTTSRQQLWMVLAHLNGENPASMSEARTWAMNNQVSDGTNATQNMTRQQMVTFLYRYCTLKGYTVSGSTPTLSNFSDNNLVSDYAEDALLWAVGNGIITGTSQGMLNPTGTTSRAQFAVILERFYQNIVNA